MTKRDRQHRRPSYAVVIASQTCVHSDQIHYTQPSEFVFVSKRQNIRDLCRVAGRKLLLLDDCTAQYEDPYNSCHHRLLLYELNYSQPCHSHRDMLYAIQIGYLCFLLASDCPVTPMLFPPLNLV